MLGQLIERPRRDRVVRERLRSVRAGRDIDHGADPLGGPEQQEVVHDCAREALSVLRDLHVAVCTGLGNSGSDRFGIALRPLGVGRLQQLHPFGLGGPAGHDHRGLAPEPGLRRGRERRAGSHLSQRLTDHLARHQRHPRGDLGGPLRLLGLRIEVHVHVRERPGRRQADRVVIGGAFVTAGQGARKAGDDEAGEDEDDRDRPRGRDQAPPRDDRQRAPEIGDSARDRPRGASDDVEQVRGQVTQAAQAVTHGGRLPAPCGSTPSSERNR